MTKRVSPNKSIFILIAIIIFVGSLSMFRLSRADMQTDGAFYSMWSVSYLDYLYSEKQTTPIQWFGEVPWWGNLSFHAPPPLVFFIFHMFFRVFGESVFIARLPSALAGVGSVALLYFLGRKLYDEKRALSAAFILSASTYFIWASRLSYLEGVEIFFILLSLLLLEMAIKNRRFFALFGIGLGLALLTKYSAMFLVPFTLAYIFFRKKELFKSAGLYVSYGISLLVFSPVVIYNAMMYVTRGHFDVQFSHLFGPWMFDAAKKDWPLLFRDGDAGANYWESIKNIPIVIGSIHSLPAIIFGIGVLLFMAWKIVKNKSAKKHAFALLYIAFLTIFFMFTKSEIRYLSLYMPALALMVSAGFFDLYESAKKNSLRIALISFGIAVLGAEIFYNINTNHRITPIGKRGVLYSEHRLEGYGFQNLENFLRDTWGDSEKYKPRPLYVRSISEVQFKNDDLSGGNVYVYDWRLNWFATMWAFYRPLTFHNVMYIEDLQVAKRLKDPDDPYLLVNWFDFFQGIGVKNLYYIKGVDERIVEKSSLNHEQSELPKFLEGKFSEAAKDPVGEMTEIRNDAGDLMFRVYRVNLNN